MNSIKRMRQGNDGDAGGEAPSATAPGSTRRSWLAGVGGVLAAGTLATAFGAVPTGEPERPRSPWPYQTPGVEFVLEARVTIAPMIDIGDTSYGHRRIIPITGGAFHGPRLSGTVLDEGEDTQLVRPDGVTEIAARYTLRTHDGILIYVVNRGLIVPEQRAEVKPTTHSALPMPKYVRTIPSLETSLAGGYEWLNQALYVGTLNPLPPAERAVVVRFFKVT